MCLIFSLEVATGPGQHVPSPWGGTVCEVSYVGLRRRSNEAGRLCPARTPLTRRFAQARSPSAWSWTRRCASTLGQIGPWHPQMGVLANAGAGNTIPRQAPNITLPCPGAFSSHRTAGRPWATSFEPLEPILGHTQGGAWPWEKDVLRVHAYAHGHVSVWLVRAGTNHMRAWVGLPSIAVNRTEASARINHCCSRGCP